MGKAGFASLRCHVDRDKTEWARGGQQGDPGTQWAPPDPGRAWAGRRERAAAWRRVRALEREVAELKKARIEEIPRIPDRDLEA